MPESSSGPRGIESFPLLDSRIASGFTADVFALDGEGQTTDRVLKLFHPWVERAAVEREFNRTRALHAAGAPCPAAYEVVQVENRHGIVFERIHGDSMVTKVAKKPWTLFAAARRLAELHAAIHQRAAPPELPHQREQLERRILDAEGFREDEKQRVLEHIAGRTPDSAVERLCHGDFHPGNILFNEKAEDRPVIIDWSAATRGNPLADVARTSVLFEQAEIPSFVPLRIRIIMKFARRLLHRHYLHSYLQLRPGSTIDEIEFWRVPQRFAGAAWLAARRRAMAKSTSSRRELRPGEKCDAELS